MNWFLGLLVALFLVAWGLLYRYIYTYVYIYISFTVFRLSKVAAVIAAGYLDMVVDLESLSEFWAHFLMDYPDHPAGRDSDYTHVPLTLYGSLAKRAVLHLMWKLLFT